MTKDKFLQQLNASLKRLSEKERADILKDYEEHFTFGLEEGKTEEEITASLGSPAQIAKELLADYHLEKVTASATTGNVFRAIWAVIGLGFFNLVIVLGPAIALAALIFSGWVLGISFLGSPLLVIVDTIVHPNTFLLFNLFASLAFCGLGYFVVIAMLSLTKLANNGFVRYLKFNIALVKGGFKHDK
ncbi:HAAS signaling domain-containing protein [Bacillus mycoides]|uniref:HAAS signaling domain-containing protein n=1 Tax=Bacillus mycoides TaxID=1405 RepID=UPI003D21D7AA